MKGERPVAFREKRELSERGKKTLAASAIAVFIIITLVVAWFVGRPLLRFVSEPEHFRAWVDKGGVMSRVYFLGIQILQVFVAIIPGEPIELGAGYAFGALEGTLLCIGGSVAGSMLIYFFVRRFGVKAVEIFFSQEKIHSLRFLKSAKRRDVLVFLLMFIPGTPKDLLSYFVPLTGMGPWTWLFITSVARLPSIVTSTVGGNALGVQNYVFAIIALSATAAVSCLGLLIYRYICKKHDREEAERRNGGETADS